jgi:2-dehydropantoate 2-reductase
MRIAIIGAGAIGGYVGARLALAGNEITFMVRGENLRAIRRSGLRLISADGSEELASNVHATDDYASAGPQDFVILAMKAHQVEAIADDIGALLGPETPVVTMQNGIPFWYFHKHGGPLEGSCVQSVDPGCILVKKIEARRIIGCVVYPASELVAPGVVRHIEGARFPLGELDGSSSERVIQIADCFTRAGFKRRCSTGSAARYGSSSGAISLSIRSAAWRTPRLPISVNTRRPGSSLPP